MKTFEVIECKYCRFFQSKEKRCSFHNIYTSPIAFCSIGEDNENHYCKEIYLNDSTPIIDEEPVCESCKIDF